MTPCLGHDAGRKRDASVTLVLHNSADHLTACLASLRPDVDGGAVEVIAVDNATPDDSVGVLARELPGAKLIRAARNLGFAGACNLAWPEVGGRYWLLLNPDVVLESGALSTLVTFMDLHPRTGAASPWLREPGSETAVNPGRAFPSIAKTLLELFRLHRLVPARVRARLLLGPYLDGAHAGDAPAADWIPGTAMLVRPDAVRDAGLLSEAFFLYGEDLEWCWRIRRAGWEIRSCPAAVALHHESSSSARTWTRHIVDARIARGMIDACVTIHGALYARAYGLLMALAATIESRHPGRSRSTRARSLAAARAWRQAALTPPSPPSQSPAKASQDVDAHNAGVDPG